MAPSLRKGSVAMDTVKINKGTVRLIAHRGVSGLELENTCAAFVAAGNRSYFGIETDVHVTADGNYIIIHDDTTGRVAEADLPVEETDFDVLRAMYLKCKDGSTRRDLVMPSLEEYLTICKHYEKEAVLELKRPMQRKDVFGIVEACRRIYGLEHMTFISFDFQNLKYVKETAPEARAQFLLAEVVTEEHIRDMAENGISLDVLHWRLSRELVDRLHALGLVVNCWTVDDVARAEALIAMGVDQITTNILE